MQSWGFWRTPYFSSIALWSSSHEPIMMVDDFINDMTWEFSINKQKECIEKWIFSDEEMSFLRKIYKGLDSIYKIKCEKHKKWEIDIWKNWSLNDEEMKDVEKLVIDFFSLESMQQDMDIIRKNKFYKWFGSFY